MIALVDASDGLVYVGAGACRLGARACLTHTIQIAGPNRILHIVVNTNRDRHGLIGAIGHELQHAIEVLRNPVEAGLQIAREMRAAARVSSPVPAFSIPRTSPGAAP